VKVRCSVAGLILAIGSLLPTFALASTWRLVSVAQPLFGEGYISIRDVPYGEGSFVPGAEVALTCEPNAVRMVGEGMEGETENRNAANKIDLSVQAGPFWNGTEFFDTLTVDLDATHADSAAAALGIASDSVIEATVLCLRINAERSGFQDGIPLAHDRTKYLKVRVLGFARLHGFAQTYKIAPLQLPGRTYELGPRLGR
jgi:hypothetical protein